MKQKHSTARAERPAVPLIPIREIRGQRILLDSDLAAIYGVSTSRFNEAIKRNEARFPSDFRFQLTAEEAIALTSQNAILKKGSSSTSQKARSKPGRGRHRKYLPFAFTEHGALQAANVLKSERANAMSVLSFAPLSRCGRNSPGPAPSRRNFLNSNRASRGGSTSTSEPSLR
ncbi:MAG: hypothetical protein JWM33_1427 [Caulobacteraceae bacterium]|nr:hypothetical protein [Caulobacteraceae bacterium]